MQNCIAILIDSVFAECISNRKTEESSTPFIDNLAKRSLVADNIYSYGPYTDAATIGLYNGVPTLSNFGYYYGINSSEYNHFRVFHENGYETFGLFYPYYLLSAKIRKDIDHPVYTGGFKFSSVWGGKFEYFARVRNTRSLTYFEYHMMEKCLDMVFDCWFGFYNDIACGNGSDVIVRSLGGCNGTGLDGLKEERRKYGENKREYIDGILTLGMRHPLAKVNEFDFGKESDLQFLKKVYAENKTFFRKIKQVNFCKNLAHSPFRFKKAFKGVRKFFATKNKGELRYVGNYGMLLFAPKMMMKRSLEKNWQDMASLDKQVKAVLAAIDERADANRPFYASLHVLEPHHNISCFSFDCFDFEQIREELAYLAPLVSRCGKKFHGNLLYQLSLRYVDLCIKKLYTALEERGLADSTTIMLVADHGSSYFFDPPRTHVVNTFHRENYKIPLLIYSKKQAEKIAGRYTDFYMSEDILPTLFSINGIPCPEQMKGRVIDGKIGGRSFVITEYMGPGVPDMMSREAWMSVRDSRYVIAYIVPLDRQFDPDCPAVLYDLRKDPEERNNIAGLVKVGQLEAVQPMLSALQARFNEIRAERDRIAADFEHFNVIGS